MKRCILLSVLCLLCALLLPWALMQESKSKTDGNIFPSSAQKAAPSPSPAPAAPSDRETVLSFSEKGAVRTVTMAEYLPGVLAGEMPASFDSQALRAQAVAARTYVLYHLAEERAAHPGASVCSDPGCCQVWLDEQTLREKWGPDYDYYWDRICSAVEATDGQYLSYEDRPILACFHSSSAGYTENSAAVWGASLPYLVSVSSPETEEDVPNFVSTVEVSPEEFRSLAEAALPEAVFSDLPADWLGERTQDPSGRVSSIRIGGTSVAGTTVRNIFSLRSSNFRLEWTGHSFLFTVTGYGHGAGMSQYGANVMARNGSTYPEILAHYYPGTTLVTP